MLPTGGQHVCIIDDTLEVIERHGQPTGAELGTHASWLGSGAGGSCCCRWRACALARFKFGMGVLHIPQMSQL